jgi:hypothetical protein
LRKKKLIAIWRNFAPKRTPCFNPGSDIFVANSRHFAKNILLQIPSFFQGNFFAKKMEKKSPPKFTTTAYNQYFSFCGEISQLGEFVFQKMKKKNNSFVCDFRKNFAIF